MNKHQNIVGIITDLRAPNHVRNDGLALVRCQELVSNDNPCGIVAVYGKNWDHHGPAHAGMRVTLGRLTEVTRCGDRTRRWTALSAKPAPAVAPAYLPARRSDPQARQPWITRLFAFLGINITRLYSVSYFSR